MNYLKTFVLILTVNAMLLYITSCNKDKKQTPTTQITYINRVAQDSAYRVGKWVSCRDSIGNPWGSVQDTLWFVNDTLVGYSSGGTSYWYGPYFFWNNNYFVFTDPGITSQTVHGTYKELCYTNNDTFQIVWGTAQAYPRPFNYVKVKE